MRKIEKPWGHELIWAETEKYVGKILHVKAGRSLSRQYHKVKEETLLVQFGEMDLEVGTGEDMKLMRLFPGDVYHVKPGTVHRIIAASSLDVIEVSTPELDDVVRLQDDYGRTGH